LNSDNKYPKAAQIRALREKRENERLDALKAAVSIRPRCKSQQDECKAAEDAIAKKRKPK
jgi:hypothetical protein